MTTDTANSHNKQVITLPSYFRASTLHQRCNPDTFTASDYTSHCDQFSVTLHVSQRRAFLCFRAGWRPSHANLIHRPLNSAATLKGRTDSQEWASELLNNRWFTAKQFVLAPNPLRHTTKVFFFFFTSKLLQSNVISDDRMDLSLINRLHVYHMYDSRIWHWSTWLWRTTFLSDKSDNLV
jgi:hypothetical protein